MDVQLELFFPTLELTVSDALAILWQCHLANRPSGKSYMYNRKWICQVIGHIQFKDLSEIHINSLLDSRRGYSGQTIRHDIQLLILLCNKFKRWKKKKLKFEKVDFENTLLPRDDIFEDIRKPKGNRREYILSENDWSILMEHGCDDMIKRAYFAIDTGLLECDLRRLRVSQYDPRRDAIMVQRSKTGKSAVIPVTQRCKEIILEAKKNKREFVLDWTNHINQWRKLRLERHINFQWRDIRKTAINSVHRFTGDILKAQRLAIHASPRTTWDHYIIDDGQDIRPAVENIQKVYASR